MRTDVQDSNSLFLEEIKRAYQLEKQAKEIGFYWSNPQQILTQIRSEVTEIEQVIEPKGSHEQLNKEIGDLFHAVLSLCYFFDLNLDEVLKKSLNKFEKRFTLLKKLMTELQIKTLHGNAQKALDLWEKAKDINRAAGED
jgi:uncharacterized protein YabN with tetrapyrrole methylase and pyrophosphatase domain